MRLIFQPEVMFRLCLNFNESWAIYAYKRYVYKKVCTEPKVSLYGR